MTAPFNPVVVVRNGEAVVVSVSGELDASSSIELREVLVELAAEPQARVLIDLGETDFIDSTGVGVLLGGLRRMEAAGGTLALRHVPPRLNRVLEVAGLAKIFPRAD